MRGLESLFKDKNNIDHKASVLSDKDIKVLISLLNEKIDDVRYISFLILQQRSKLYKDVYPYWDEFYAKLGSENSYQRSIGIMLLAENIRWDSDNKFDSVIVNYLEHCTDEKFITCRQTIQSINVWIGDLPKHHKLVIEKLIKIDIAVFKESQRKLVLLDILNVLAQIEKKCHYDEISEFVSKALTGGYLDKKSKAKVEALFNKKN